MRFYKDKDHSDKSIDYMFIEEGIIMGIHGENPPLMKTRKKIVIAEARLLWLKLLNELRDLYGRRLVINPTKYEGNGVDEKLLKITEDMTGTLITADYNLSQIAEVKELKVMNLSDLVIALRPEVQPGESLNIKIVREGKEKMQGIGYLDDGTMVVIDEAKNFVGSRLDIVITGALQTPTGRMVFGKLINNPESNKSFKSPATQG